jgi:hypothetical protein
MHARWLATRSGGSRAVTVRFGIGAVTVAIAATSACSRDEREERLRALQHQTEAPAAVASRLGLDAGEVVAPVDPPGPPGDLRAEVTRFTSIDACVAKIAPPEPLVGDALRAIGYETFLRDTCRLLEATKGGDVQTCGRIDAQALRAKCESFVAMAWRRPDACPWAVPNTHERGRDPSCVAVASRDPRLCAATSRGAVQCEALARHDAKKCGVLAEPDRGACERDVLRWQSLLESPLEANAAAHLQPPATDARPIKTPVGHLTLRPAGTDEGSADVEADLAHDLAHGVVAERRREGIVVQIGEKRELGLTWHTTNPNARARVAIELLVPTAPGLPARVSEAEFGVPGSTTVVVGQDAPCACELRMKAAGAQRGEPFEFTLTGKAGVGARTYTVELAVATFVRDVVNADGTVAVEAPHAEHGTTGRP